MQRYRHVTVEVEAMQLTKENAEEVAAWCGGVVKEETNPADHTDVYVAVDYPTMDGIKRLSEGMYLAKAEGGSFVKHSPGFFTTMFNPVEETPRTEQRLQMNRITTTRQI